MTSAQSVAVAIAVLSAEQFEDSFGDFMLEGLDSGPTYVPFVVGKSVV